MGSDDADMQVRFAAALLAPGTVTPAGLVAASAHRFAVYRNNVAVRLIEALEANFPAVRRAVGEEFFAGLAQNFIAAHPPRLPMLTCYGDKLPAFLRDFPPVDEIAYLPDLAAIEAARTRATYATDVDPLPGYALSSIAPEALAELRVVLHPAVSIVTSIHPIVTIWAMNTGAMPVTPIADWRAESAVIARPQHEVAVSRLPPGGGAFLIDLASGVRLGEATAAAIAADAAFDLGFNLAYLFNYGLVARLTFQSHEG